MSSNDVTLQSYERAVSEYIAGTPHEPDGGVKSWIGATLELLPRDARILEIGSAFGRDANYIESHGFTVERTDATEGFISLLQGMGHTVRRLNVLKDEFPSHYDLVYANAVFLHFTREEFEAVLKKVHAGLNERGILSFSLKKGEGEEWSTGKIGRPRYFLYWSLERMQTLLQATGFQVISTSQDTAYLRVIARKE